MLRNLGGVGISLSCCLFLSFLLIPATVSAQAFVNYETAHVHPIDVSPDGNTLVVCNTPDNRIQIFDISSGVPVRPSPPLIDHVQVGVDPVTVRFLTNTEVWVVNHISDSISIVNLTTGLVRQTIDTLDEPADVVFAGAAPLKAFVSCSQVNIVQVFSTTSPGSGTITNISIEGEDPRALAVNQDGTRVFAAIFESGNKSTIIPGGFLRVSGNPEPIEPVNNITGPYLGVNPPPNFGSGFSPPKNSLLPVPPPEVSHIVKKDGAGRWMDDNGGDWTTLVTGGPGAGSDRVLGWDLIDNDVAIIDTANFSVTYAEGIANIITAVAFNPATNSVTAIGIDGTNEIRFEPNITGTFIRDNLGAFSDGSPGAVAVHDLNAAHLDAAQGGAGMAYIDGDVAQSERDKSIGDPRGIVWTASGKGYVSGMGSNNVIPLLSVSMRTSLGATIEVGEGPTGLALNPAETHLYVLNKFAGSVTTIDTTTDTVMGTVAFFDPSPQVIKVGRKHLYDTHKTSGLGNISCGSCHIDGRMDRLAWDLGDPSGFTSAVTLATHNMGMGLLFLDTRASTLPPWEDSHPMKGPMTTQTLQDIIGKEPLHWRGDRQGIESFNPAFVGLNGDDTKLTLAEMQEFEDFLERFYFPPNPFRNLDNTLPASLPLPGQSASGFFSKSFGTPLDPGDPRRGLRIYMGTEIGASQPFGRLDTAFNCVTCHTLPVGNGADSILRADNLGYDPIPTGPMGQHHIGMVSVDISTNIAIKIPHLRNGFDKVGFDRTQLRSRAGFGYFHDGSIDTLASFLSPPTFIMTSDQDQSDLVALMLAFSGSDFGDPPQNPPFLFFNGLNVVPVISEPPSIQFSKDTHAAVGKQVTINASTSSRSLINMLVDLSAAGAVDLVVKGVKEGNARGWYHLFGLSSGTPTFQSDSAAETVDLTTLLAFAGAGAELTFTVVHEGSGERLGVDRDGDLVFDFDELTQGSDPADPLSLPGPRLAVSPSALSATINEGQSTPSQSFDVRNSGGGVVQYSIVVDVNWLSISPTSGTSAGETDTINVHFNTLGLTPGVYAGTITVTSSGATDSPQTVLVTLTVKEIPNIAPIAFAQAVLTTRNTEVQITLTGNDGESAPTQTLTFLLSALPANGDVSLTSGGPAITGGLPLTLSGPTLYYTPDINFVGTDTFRFRVMDDGGTANGGIDLSAEATVTLDVVIRNSEPHAFPQSVTTLKDTELRITLNGDDGEPIPSQSLAFILRTLPTNGTLALFSGGAPISGALPITLSDPTVYYIPGTGHIGSDNFQFQVMDDGGTDLGGIDVSTEATVVLHVIEPLVAEISTNTLTLLAVINEGETTPTQTFTISNSGTGTLNYSMSVDVNWLSVTPALGTATGETDSITVNFFVSTLPPGIHTALISLRDGGATNSPQIIAVTLTVLAVEGIPTSDTGSVLDGSGGGCFIATATYGTPMAQEIDALREVRDTYLLSNAPGAAFVDTYYRFSPPVADFVARHPAAATTTRVLLTPIIAMAKVLWMLPLLTVLFILAMTGFIVSRIKCARNEAGA